MKERFLLIQRGLIHLFFILWMLFLPISKGLSSAFMVGLLIMSVSQWIVEKVNLKACIRQHPEIASMSLLFFVFLISVGYSSDWQEGLEAVYKRNSFLVIPFIFLMNLPLLDRQGKVYLSCFIFSNCFASLLTTYFFLLPEVEAMQRVTELSFLNIKPYVLLSKRTAFGIYSPFLNRLHFGNLLSLATLASFFLLAVSRKKFPYILAIIILLSGGLVLGSRGSQLGLLVGVGIWIIGGYFYSLHQRLSQKIGKTPAILLFSAALGIVMLLIPYLLYRNVPALTQRYNQMFWELQVFYDGPRDQYEYVHFTSIRRILSWQNTWKLVQESPILGVGIGDYAQEMERIYAQDPWDFPVNNHNWFLYLWANSGLLALVVFLFVLIYTILNVYKSANFFAKVWGLSLIFFYFVILTLDVVLASQVDSMAFAIMFSFLAILAQNRIKTLSYV